MIKAWDVALKTMKVNKLLSRKRKLFTFWEKVSTKSFYWFFQVGEVAKITCQPDYAYGAAGSPPDIPPG